MKSNEMEIKQVSDTTLINELWQEYVSAVNAGDMQRWIDLWIEDGIQLPPGAARRAGKEHIRAEMQPEFDLFDTRMVIYPKEIQVLEDHAYSHGLYKFVTALKEKGNSIEVKGKFLTVLRKQIDGTWKIAIDCFNYDTPLT